MPKDEFIDNPLQNGVGGRQIGYMRVSTADQDLSLQRDALQNAGVVAIFQDICSGKKMIRPGLSQMLKSINANDTVVVYKLDRLGRSLKETLELIDYFKKHDISFKILKENIDTNTSTGKLMLHFFAMIAEFEADLIKDRTMAGLAAARSRGRIGGRPAKLNTTDLIRLKELYNSGQAKISEICSIFKIKRSTFYKYLNT